MAHTKDYLKHCLYFSANSLAREITRMADEEFRETGLFPSQAFLVMLVHENPGIGPLELSEILHLAPSTVTRLSDSMTRKRVLKRNTEGRLVKIYLTPKGKRLNLLIKKSWKNLYRRYVKILGEEYSVSLTNKNYEASIKLKG